MPYMSDKSEDINFEEIDKCKNDLKKFKQKLGSRKVSQVGIKEETGVKEEAGRYFPEETEDLKKFIKEEILDGSQPNPMEIEGLHTHSRPGKTLNRESNMTNSKNSGLEMNDKPFPGPKDSEFSPEEDKKMDAEDEALNVKLEDKAEPEFEEKVQPNFEEEPKPNFEVKAEPNFEPKAEMDFDDKAQLEFDEKNNAVNLEIDSKPEDISPQIEESKEEIIVEDQEEEPKEEPIDIDYNMMDKPDDFEMNGGDMINLEDNQGIYLPPDENLLENTNMENGQDIMMDGQEESLLELD